MPTIRELFKLGFDCLEEMHRGSENDWTRASVEMLQTIFHQIEWQLTPSTRGIGPLSDDPPLDARCAAARPMIVDGERVEPDDRCVLAREHVGSHLWASDSWEPPLVSICPQCGADVAAGKPHDLTICLP